MNRVKKLFSDKDFLSKVVKITIPIAGQGLLNNTINFVDTLMIGKLGETTISAVGLANKVFFVFSLLLFGICSGSSILTAQYYGSKDNKNVKKVLGLAVALSIIASLIFLIPSLLNPELVIRIFTTNEETIKIGATYLFIVAIGYPFTAITNSYIAMLRGVNQVKVPVIISSISIVVNVVFNYILIYGKFGAPALGVAGAAIATVLARLVECATLLIIVYKGKGIIAAKPKEMFHFDSEFLRKYRTTVVPIIFNEFIWGLGVTIYALAYGRMGDNAMAAITITQITEQVLQVLAMSISNAAAVLLGNELGAGKLKEAEEHAKTLIAIQIVLTIIIAILCFVCRDIIIGMFEVSPEVQSHIRKCFLVYIIFLPFRMFNCINVVGILRSGGDTKACLFIDCTSVWFIGIPMAFIGGLVLKQPIYIVYAMVNLEEIYKFILGIIRYRKKIWIKNLVS